MIRQCGIAKCPVVILAHLNPLDQTRRTKCKLAVTITSRKQVNIWSTCSGCVANAIKMVLKFFIYKNEICTYFLALFFLHFSKKSLSCFPHLKGRQLLLSVSEYFLTLVYQHKRLKLCE